MSIQGRIDQLSNRHKALDQKIREEQSRPSTDTLRIKDLKRQKLHIKEELEALREN